ncbi:MAG: hypothetical protein Fur0037_10110 [Planctomycetota bacterium]
MSRPGLARVFGLASPALTVGLLVLPACMTVGGAKVSRIDVQAVAEDQGAAGALVWGLGRGAFGPPPSDASSGGEVRKEPGGQDPQGQDRERYEAAIRAQFGSSVMIGADGRVTKQYFMAGALGETFLKLITEIVPGQPLPDPAKAMPAPGTRVGGPKSNSILGRMLGENVVEITYISSFEDLRAAQIADLPQANAPPRVTGAPLPMEGDKAMQVALVLVTGLPSALAAFENSLNLFYTSIPQIEISVQVIEYSSGDALAFGVGTIDANTPNIRSLSSSRLIQSYTSIFPLRAPVVGSNPISDIGLFTLGGIHNSWELNAQLQALEANNLADITSSPKVVVRNGGVASISTLTDIPFPRAKINQLGSQVATDIQFKPVGVKMNIVPVIAGTDSVILQIYADVSAVTGFASTDPVVTPVTSTRTAVTTVYLKNNHSLLIGGLKSISQFENETKVPLLGDIPLLGMLFRSTSTTRQETNVAFQITPRIIEDRGQPVKSGDLGM